MFDIVALVGYVRKAGTHPITGAPLSLADVIPLTYHKNVDGEYHCPVLAKVFTQHTKIAAVKTTGNVYSYEVRCAGCCVVWQAPQT